MRPRSGLHVEKITSATASQPRATPRAALYAMTHSGLGCIYMACLCFSIMNQGIRHTSTGRNFQDRVCRVLCQ